MEEDLVRERNGRLAVASTSSGRRARTRVDGMVVCSYFRFVVVVECARAATKNDELSILLGRGAGGRRAMGAAAAGGDHFQGSIASSLLRKSMDERRRERDKVRKHQESC